MGFSLQQQQKTCPVVQNQGTKWSSSQRHKNIPPLPGHPSPPALLPLLSASVSALAQSTKQLQKAPGNPWAGSLIPEQGEASPEKPVEQRGGGTGCSSTALSPCPPSSSVLGRTRLRPGTALGWMGTGTEEWEQKCHKPVAGGQVGDMGKGKPKPYLCPHLQPCIPQGWDRHSSLSLHSDPQNTNSPAPLGWGCQLTPFSGTGSLGCPSI